MEWLKQTIEQIAQRVAGVDYVAAQQKLQDIYRVTWLLILEKTSTVAGAADPPGQLMRVLSYAGQLLQDADQAAAGWINTYLPAAFRAGVQQAEQQMYQQGVGQVVGASMNMVNTGAVQALQNETMADLLAATARVEETVKVTVRQVVLDEVRMMAATGMRAQEASREIADRLAVAQIFGIEAKNGRWIPMDNYARMVAHYKLRDAHTQGIEQLVADYGQDLVQVSEHLHIPDLCSPLEGKVYSLTGNTPGYQQLPRHTPFHVGCRHVEMPYILTFRSDSAIEADREKSNQEGPIVVWPQKKIDELEAKRERRAKKLRAVRQKERADAKAVAQGKMAPSAALAVSKKLR